MRRELASSIAENRKLAVANGELTHEVARLKVEVDGLTQQFQAVRSQAPMAPLMVEKSVAPQSQGDFSFEAFVRLKKENKELKLEVLKLSTPHSKLVNKMSAKGGKF